MWQSHSPNGELVVRLSGLDKKPNHQTKSLADIYIYIYINIWSRNTVDSRNPATFAMVMGSKGCIFSAISCMFLEPAARPVNIEGETAMKGVDLGDPSRRLGWVS